MTGLTIGWYVHHHGRGHLTRFEAIRPLIDARVVVFSSLEAPQGLPADTEWVALPRDDETETGPSGVRDPSASDPAAGGLLHWAPLNHAGHRSRLARIAVESLRSDVGAFVVDVSVEVAVFVRLLGIPVVVVAQPGDRSDDPHRLAYRAANRILAPWPEGLVARPTFDDGADVVHTGGISRFEGRSAVPTESRSGIAVLLGAGGHAVTADDLDAFSAALPGETTTVLGGPGSWQSDPWPILSTASVVVSWAGQNSIADLAIADARAVVIPQARPFGEQDEMADALATHRLATVETTWPDAWNWADVIDRARAQEPTWSTWQTTGATRRAADAITEIADRWAR